MTSGLIKPDGCNHQILRYILVHILYTSDIFLPIYTIKPTKKTFLKIVIFSYFLGTTLLPLRIGVHSHFKQFT